MGKLYERSFIGMLVLAIALCATSCRTTQSLDQPAPRPITSIRVGNFRCDNEVTGLAVRNVFIEILTRDGAVKVVREGEADVVIEGTVTLAKGDSSSGSIGGGAVIFGTSQRVGGDYVSGVTSLALRDGEILTSASWGQNLGEGETLLPPESVARKAVDRLLKQLVHEGLKRR